MRLIDTDNGDFVEFADLENIPPYAILSHTWEKTGEQSYQEVLKIQEKYRHCVRYQPSLKVSGVMSHPICSG